MAPDTGKKGALRNNYHALLAARKHDVHSVQKPQETGLVGAHNGEDNVVRFMACSGFALL